MNTIPSKNSSISFGMDLSTFRYFMTKICIFLFFRILNSKSHQLLITTESKFTNRIQREFDSNVRIATFQISPASSHPHQTTNLLKRSSPSQLLCFSDLSSCFWLFAEMLRAYSLTESKGNFCLITVYSHKTLFQPQAIPAKTQTFPNFPLLLCFSDLSSCFGFSLAATYAFWRKLLGVRPRCCLNTRLRWLW
jgi:hypothetical protein